MLKINIIRSVNDYNFFQHEENLGLMKTRPRLIAFEYSLMLVTRILCLLSLSALVTSGSYPLKMALLVDFCKSALKSGSLYCSVFQIPDCFLAATSNTSGLLNELVQMLLRLQDVSKGRITSNGDLLEFLLRIIGNRVEEHIRRFEVTIVGVHVTSYNRE